MNSATGGHVRTWWSKHGRWLVLVALIAAGAAFVFWAREKDGWAQAWRIEVGVAFALLGPLYFAEELLRSRVKALEDTLARSADVYGGLRSVLPSGDGRTHVIDELLKAVSLQAAEGRYQAEDIASLLARRDETSRTVALAAMQGQHDLIDEVAVVRSIRKSLSGMEQYHAMKLANEAWLRLSGGVRREVLDALSDDAAGRRFIAPGSRRAALAESIRRQADGGARR